MEEKKNNIGRIVQALGPVIDVSFEDGHLPEILTALKIELSEDKYLVVEVMQHIGDDIVRCVAMGPTDGLVRGMKVIDTGNPISVPVGEETLGRMFNVLGEPIDGLGGDFSKSIHMPIHRPAPTHAEQKVSH